jgi:hypothetical protein
MISEETALAPVYACPTRCCGQNIALSKAESWKRGEEFPKEFVTLPGETYPSPALMYACSPQLREVGGDSPVPKVPLFVDQKMLAHRPEVPPQRA